MTSKTPVTPKRKFGLITTIAMIVGIVIGSGIFFKTPLIIKETNGNVLMGILSFVVAAFGIIFGGLTIAQYSSNDDKIGGLVSYCEMSWGKTMGFLAGWFQSVVYYPAIIAVIAWVAANYTFGLFGLDNLLTTGTFNPGVWFLAIGYLIFYYIVNTFQTKKAGHFQDFAMYAKILALLVLSIAGLIIGNPTQVIASSPSYTTSMNGFLNAVIAVAFATDGWMIAPSIAHEIKDPKKNLTKALIFAPLVIIAIYLLYFIGVCAFVGPDALLAGVDPISTISNALFGPWGIKIVLLFIVISVLGTLNGLILGYIRTPYALAVRGELPFSEKIAKINTKSDTPINASIFAFMFSILYLLFHFLTLDGSAVYNFNLLDGLAVDDLPIVMNYLFLCFMYFGVLLRPDKVKASSFWGRYVFPILAILGSFIILYGGVSRPKFNIYMGATLVIILIGLLIRRKKSA
ncbi:amino acid permease [Anaerorhabdus sp.]|uniref:APC family permease n=1 Tax=Anaerorhabdus sp. TaxID=1872524 RepID=UPI002B2013C2|nr:amino acid permease [Anaerorhabdus sp.]MEA4875033.1 amino acid permease [Anaerorhabdus sp.]